MGIHDKHRERMRQRFLDSGGEGFEDYQLLELFLFCSIPRGDTNPAAHELINKFGGIKEVFDAPVHELAQVKGVGERSAFAIKLAQRLAVSYIKPSAKRRIIMDNSEIVGEYLVPKFFGADEELVILLCLDSKGGLINCSEVQRGSLNAADISFRKIAETALAKKAASVIIAHNHPSGVALPSREDEKTTWALKKALALVNVALIDHIILVDSDYISMADSGLM